ncbi:MAG TPA: hypothetical protein VHK90_14045 [Thermoanaerobaculia bacterium]|nr:hypothetical protein [Thermoanaerobaculia bacterium]
MHRRLGLLALCLLTLNVRAVTLDDVRRSLAELRGASPLNVKIDSHHRRNDDEKKKVESSGTSRAEDDGTHLRLVHDKNELRKLNAKTEAQRADHSVSATEAFDLMNYAPRLLKTLEGATLKRVTQSTLDGTVATLLEIVPVREKDEDGDRWIKNYVDTLLLWIGPNGVPIAAERTQKIKARIVVIGAEFDRKEKFRFVRTGDRLVVSRMSSESSASGLGQKESGVKSASVSIVR